MPKKRKIQALFTIETKTVIFLLELTYEQNGRHKQQKHWLLTDLFLRCMCQFVHLALMLIQFVRCMFHLKNYIL